MRRSGGGSRSPAANDNFGRRQEVELFFGQGDLEALVEVFDAIIGDTEFFLQAAANDDLPGLMHGGAE